MWLSKAVNAEVVVPKKSTWVQCKGEFSIMKDPEKQEGGLLLPSY